MADSDGKYSLSVKVILPSSKATITIGKETYTVTDSVAHTYKTSERRGSVTVTAETVDHGTLTAVRSYYVQAESPGDTPAPSGDEEKGTDDNPENETSSTTEDKSILDREILGFPVAYVVCAAIGILALAAIGRFYL